MHVRLHTFVSFGYSDLVCIQVSIDYHQDNQHEKREAYEDETEYKTASEGYMEGLLSTLACLFGCSHISIHSDLHAYVAGENRGERAE